MVKRYRLLHIPSCRKYWKEVQSKDDNVFSDYTNIVYDNDNSGYFSLGYSYSLLHWNVSLAINKEEFMWIEEEEND